MRPSSLSIEKALKEALEQSEGLTQFVSLRPRKRPDNITQGPAPSIISSAREIPSDQIPVGTALVQLGAFAGPDVARSEWVRLSSKFSSFMTGRDLVIQRAVSGGSIFYRLRAAGFSDLSDAQRFCSALKAANTDCVPVVTR